MKPDLFNRYCEEAWARKRFLLPPGVIEIDLRNTAGDYREVQVSDLPEWLLDMLHPHSITRAEFDERNGYRVEQPIGMFFAGKTCPAWWGEDRPDRIRAARSRRHATCPECGWENGPDHINPSGLACCWRCTHEWHTT